MNWADVKEILVALLTLGLGGAGVVLWSLYLSVRKEAARAHTRIESLGAELANYRTHVAENYVTQPALAKALNSVERTVERLIEAFDSNSKEMRESISQIHRRVDQKADK